MDKHETYRLAHPEFVRATNQAWCEANRDKRNAQNRKARQARIEFTRECKAGKVCVRCQGTDKLHFHHVDPTTKLFTIGRSDRSIKAITLEMAKCILLCSSCHHKTHRDMKKTP
jgi:hypothetical protein